MVEEHERKCKMIIQAQFWYEEALLHKDPLDARCWAEMGQRLARELKRDASAALWVMRLQLCDAEIAKRADEFKDEWKDFPAS